MEGFLDKRKVENEASFKEVMHVLDEAYNLFSLRFCCLKLQKPAPSGKNTRPFRL